MYQIEGRKITKCILGFSAGQSLIETIVALALLVTGITGGLSLAIFAVSSSDVTLNQIIATNLAREGVEVVRNMRDANWLKDLLTDCDYGTATVQQCYLNWYSLSGPLGGYDISGNPSPGKNYRAKFDPGTNTWSLDFTNGGPGGQDYRLYNGPNGTYIHDGSGPYHFYRRIVIIRDTDSPFDNRYPRLKITSTVWWVSKRCPDVSEPSSICKVTVEDYLTNWKNY